MERCRGISDPGQTAAPTTTARRIFCRVKRSLPICALTVSRAVVRAVLHAFASSTVSSSRLAWSSGVTCMPPFRLSGKTFSREQRMPGVVIGVNSHEENACWGEAQLHGTTTFDWLSLVLPHTLPTIPVNPTINHGWGKKINFQDGR